MSDTHVALKDANSVASAIFESSTTPGQILRGQIDPVTGRILVEASGGTGFTLLSATGSVNGVNKAFTFTQLPTYIVSDGAIYQQTDNNSNVNWSWNSGTLTATMTIPPTSAIWGWV